MVKIYFIFLLIVINTPMTGRKYLSDNEEDIFEENSGFLAKKRKRPEKKRTRKIKKQIEKINKAQKKLQERKRKIEEELKKDI